MRKFLFIAVVSALLFSCSGSNPDTDTPTGVVNAFIESSRQGDIDGIKKYLTEQDVKLINMGEQFMGMMDSAQKNTMKEKMAQEFKENTKDVNIEVGNEKIDGDKATVDVSSTREGKKQTQPFSLKKENGQWKISLLSTGMKSSGMTQDEMDKKMGKFDEGMKGMNDSVAKALEQLKKIDPDSLKKLMNQGMKELEKLKEASEKLPQ